MIKTRLYFCFSVLLLTVVCIVVYTAMRSESHANTLPPQLAQEQTETINGDTPDLQQVNQAVQAEASQDRQTTVVVPNVVASDSAITDQITTFGLTVTDGCLQVYIVETGALYMETTIVYDLLPETVQTQIAEGKYFESEEALLEFLENYSS